MKTYPLSSCIEKRIRPFWLLLKLFVNHNIISIYFILKTILWSLSLLQDFWDSYQTIANIISYTFQPLWKYSFLFPFHYAFIWETCIKYLKRHFLASFCSQINVVLQLVKCDVIWCQSYVATRSYKMH